MNGDLAGGHGASRLDPTPPDSDVLNHLPADGTGQSCAICGAEEVAWVHPLARSKVAYREFGKGHTLPMFWCVCEQCEQLYVASKDREMAKKFLVTRHGAGPIPAHITDATQWFTEMAEKPIAVWRSADLGARPLA